MPVVSISCPSCRASLKLPETFKPGKAAKCPKCGGVVPVPTPPPETATGLAGEGSEYEPTEGTPASPEPTSGSRRFPFLAPPQESDELGRLGVYRVLGELGAGGMGMVFRAEDPTLRRQIALKVMLPQHATNPTAKARFLREARAQARVEHENVINIHQVGEDRGVPFIAMPLLKGQTLGAALKQNPKPPLAEVLRIGREMAEGLAAAHELRMVHRDIKPGNVWLEGNRRKVKILDFGLARSEADAVGNGLGDTDAPVTRDGAVVGTPAYMSPEQARGETVDGRTDIFALGVVMYQMAAGELPFKAPTAMGILVAVATETPAPPHRKNRDVPPALSEYIVRMLAKNPADRPASTAEIAEELRRIEQGATLPQAVPVATPIANDPWADIDASSSSSRTPAVQPPSRTEPELDAAPAGIPGKSKWLYIGGGIAALLLVGVLAIVFSGGGDKDRQAGPAPSPAPPARLPAPIPTPDPAFFNGRNLDGWVGDDKIWKVENGELVGTPISRFSAAAMVIYTKKEYADFELTFDVKITDSKAKAAPFRLCTRNELWAKEGTEFLTGVKCRLGDNSWGYLGSGTDQDVPPSVLSRIKPNDYNAVTIRCLGPVTSSMINGVPVENSRTGPHKGVIAWQPMPGLTEVRIKNIRFTDLAKNPAAAVAVPTPPPTVPVAMPAIPDGPFFNGKDLTGWVGKPGHWRVENGDIVGAYPPGVTSPNTFLYTTRPFTDFALDFQVKTQGGRGNSGLQFRSSVFNESDRSLAGPQVDMGVGFWGWLYGERWSGVMKRAPAEAETRAKPQDYNDISLRVLGKRVTITLNGFTTLDEEFDLPPSGVIGFQLHAGNDTEVRFRNIRFTDLTKPAPVAAGRVLDLLALAEPKRDAVKGTWTREGTNLAGNGNGQHAVFQFPYTPPDEYDYRIEFTRNTGDRDVSFVLVHGSQSFQWCMSQQIVNFGFSRVDGQSQFAPRPELAFENGKRYSARVEVRKDVVRCFLNDQQVSEIKPAGLKLTLFEPVRLRDERRLGLTLFQGSATIHKAEVVEVPGPGLPAASTFFNGKDLTGWLGSQAAWKVENGALVAFADPKSAADSAVLYSEKTFREFELSFRVLLPEDLQPKSKVQFWFRSKITDFDKFVVAGMNVQFGATSWGVVNVTDGTTRKLTPNSDLLAKALVPGANAVTLRCVGTKLTVAINGVALLDQHVVLPDEGAFIIEVPRGVRVEFRDICFQEFTGSPPASAIFNGKDLTGWDVIGNGTWTVVDGVIKGEAKEKKEVGWLGTSGLFTDYDLEFEYKLPPGGNSGVFLRAWKDGTTSGAGFDEIQLMDETGFAGADDLKTGSHYKKRPRSAVPTLKVGDWNTVKLKVAGKHLTCTINGTVTIDDESEFTRPSGQIGLQLLRTNVEFRNFKFTDRSK